MVSRNSQEDYESGFAIFRSSHDPQFRFRSSRTLSRIDAFQSHFTSYYILPPKHIQPRPAPEQEQLSTVPEQEHVLK